MRAAIIRQFEPLAHSLAHRFARSGAASDDLSQVALVGLVKAVDHFNPEAGVRFITFATPTILGELRHHFRNHGWLLHVPRGLQELARQVNRAEEELTDRLGRPPTASELAARLEVAEETVAQAFALRTANRPLSLDGEIEGSQGEGPTVLEASLGREDPALQRAEDRVGVRQALQQLQAPLRQVIRLRYLGQLSQRAVARELGISAMQVCRLEKQALNQLRQQLLPA
jgi:RNA polymerase sigma-B factor